MGALQLWAHSEQRRTHSHVRPHATPARSQRVLARMPGACTLTASGRKGHLAEVTLSIMDSVGRTPAADAPPSSVQAWSLGAFERQIPSGRKNVLELQTWLRDQMVTLNAAATVTGDQSADLFSYAEKMLDLYNMAFHELTRQVRPLACCPGSCPEADIVCRGLARPSWRRERQWDR